MIVCTIFIQFNETRSRNKLPGGHRVSKDPESRQLVGVVTTKT